MSVDDEYRSPTPGTAPQVLDGWLRLSRSGMLAERGDAMVFDLPATRAGRQPDRGFVIRFDGRVRAYANRCAHVPVALDWIPGQVFDADRDHLVCSVHGAQYDPASGHCLAGPCRGRGGLVALDAVEHGGWIWVRADAGPRSPVDENPRTGPPAALDFEDDD